MNPPTPEQSLAMLAEVLQPQTLPRLNRADYCAIENALQNLQAALKELAALKAPDEKKP